MNEENARLSGLLQEMRRDEQIFERFFLETRGSVRHFLQAHQVREQDADDLEVECYTVIYESCGRFRGDGKVLSWVYGIVHRKCLEYYRKRKECWPELPERADPVDYALCAALSLDLRAALDGLSREEYRMLSYRHCEGLSYRQIGQRVQRPVGTVKRMVHEARNKVRRTLS